MNYIWDSAYVNRWSWAKKAEFEFKQNLQKLDIDELLLKEELTEITIGVYGPTQVGKTTLILRLLGVRQDSIETISGWLRGKREQGHSATVTATEYKRSKDNFFHLFTKESGWKKNLTGEELEQALYDVRAQVEEWGEVSTDQMIIEIASSFFEETLPPVNLNFIDLPGIQSAEKAEQKQVQECVKRWLPLCEITLLVDDATLINSYAQIEDKNVKDWMIELDRFRIIPTHALSLESLLLDLNGEIGVEPVRHYYATELSRSLNWTLDAQELSSILYPIDIGRTLESMKSSNEGLYKRVYPMMEEILQELRDDLCSQKPEALHFKHLASIYSKAEKHKHVELEQINSKLTEIEEEISKQQKFIRRLLNTHSRKLNEKIALADDQSEIIEQVKEVLDKINAFDWESDLEDKFENPEIKKAKRASEVNSVASSFRFDWELKVEQTINSIKKIVYGTQYKDEIKPPVVNESIYFIDKVWDFYVFQGKYDDDLHYVKETARWWITELIQQVISLVEDVISTFEKEVKKEERKIKLQETKQLQELSAEEDKLQKLVDWKEEVKQHLNQTDREWQQELEYCQTLEYFFKKNAVSHYQSLKTMLKQGSTKSKWKAQHLLFLLHKDSELVLTYLKGKELGSK
ncbi:GTPase [Bacillus mesophilum]|uniref:Uncharacterized protein n=1 Tax=Bacillus mesophilum TaxID=1071718 RepID=A0A7V7RMG2_9BACI|nr:GTPase [Bacillus mesophilum]KAB2332613.1 hypothetical protein F7732_11005 [Bacillus mesophilum]